MTPAEPGRVWSLTAYGDERCMHDRSRFALGPTHEGECLFTDHCEMSLRAAASCDALSDSGCSDERRPRLSYVWPWSSIMKDGYSFLGKSRVTAECYDQEKVATRTFLRPYTVLRLSRYADSGQIGEIPLVEFMVLAELARQSLVYW